MPKTVCIIQARSTSVRFPNKISAIIGNKPMLHWVIDRIKAINSIEKLIDEIVVAIPKNDVIARNLTIDSDTKYYEGSEDNVLERYYKCAKELKADWILRITSDCPLIDPILIYGMLKKQNRKKYQALAVNYKKVPDGLDAELFSFEKLEETYKQARTKAQKEHVTTKMRGLMEDYLDCGTDFFYKDLKLSVDTEEDLRRVRELAKYL